MNKSLIVKKSIRINATVKRVWEVLTKAHYIRQWDELPEDFGDFEISPATIIEWPGYAKMQVIEFRLNEHLRYSLQVPAWKDENVTNVGYTFSISSDDEGHTQLTIEVGDFALVTEGQKYYDSSIDFGETASQKIKKLAEKREIAL